MLESFGLSEVLASKNSTGIQMPLLHVQPLLNSEVHHNLKWQGKRFLAWKYITFVNWEEKQCLVWHWKQIAAAQGTRGLPVWLLVRKPTVRWIVQT